MFATYKNLTGTPYIALNCAKHYEAEIKAISIYGFVGFRALWVFNKFFRVPPKIGR